MKIEGKDSSDYTDKYSASFSENIAKINDFEFFDSYPIRKKESIMIIDIMQQKILFAKGFKDLLGYDDDEITLDLIVSSWHPDDKNIVDRVGLATITYTFEHLKDSPSHFLEITFRRKKSDGSYIKLLSRSSAFKMDESGNIESLFIQYTDISFMDTPNIVCWNFEIDNLDTESFRTNIYKAYTDFFTEREKDIIKEIEKGFTNGSISENLNISKYTVETHRKNIFKKSKQHNTKDLLNFCKRKGII